MTLFKSRDIISFFLRSRALFAVPQRNSRYLRNYVEPVPESNELNMLYEEGKEEEFAFSPVKAATINHGNHIFHDELLNKFINMVMEGGQKQLARRLIEEGLYKIKMIQLEKYHKATTQEEKDNIEMNPIVIFHNAVTNCKPVMGFTAIRRGAIYYQVPVSIYDKRARFLSMKWLMEAINDKERKIHFPEKFAWEMLDAARYEGKVIKRKQEWHKQCEANKAYAHYRWR